MEPFAYASRIARFLCVPAGNRTKRKETVCLRTIGQEVAAHQEVDAVEVEVMVSSYRFVVDWKEIPTRLCFDINMPPRPIGGSPRYQSGLRPPSSGRPWRSACKPFRDRQRKRLMSTRLTGPAATIGCTISRHPRTKSFETNCAFDLVLCGNHQVHRVSLTIISSLGLNIVKDLYASSRVLSGSGHCNGYYMQFAMW